MKAKDERKRAASSMASASDADQMGAVEFAGQGIVPRQLQQLLVAGVALVVDADDALDARRLAVGAGEPAAGFLDPEHRRRGRGAHAVFDPVGHAVAAAASAANGRAHRSGSSAPARSALRTRRRLPATAAGMSGKTEPSMIGPGDGVAGDVPHEGGLAERSEDGRSLRNSRLSEVGCHIASFRDTAGVILCCLG